MAIESIDDLVWRLGMRGLTFKLHKNRRNYGCCWLSDTIWRMLSDEERTFIRQNRRPGGLLHHEVPKVCGVKRSHGDVENTRRLKQ